MRPPLCGHATVPLLGIAKKRRVGVSQCGGRCPPAVRVLASPTDSPWIHLAHQWHCPHVALRLAASNSNGPEFGLRDKKWQRPPCSSFHLVCSISQSELSAHLGGESIGRLIANESLRSEPFNRLCRSRHAMNTGPHTLRRSCSSMCSREGQLAPGRIIPSAGRYTRAAGSS
jgi:hypothetical protein